MLAQSIQVNCEAERTNYTAMVDRVQIQPSTESSRSTLSDAQLPVNRTLLLKVYPGEDIVTLNLYLK